MKATCLSLIGYVDSNALRYHMKFDSEMSSMSGAECNEAKGIEWMTRN